jgi:hypothetical protein
MTSDKPRGRPVPTVTTENLGAWVFKCNPAVWDLAAFMADGGDWIDDWSVADNYRSAMLANGQRALLWVTGNSPNLPRGFWGSGWVTGPVDRAIVAAEEQAEDDESTEPEGYWIDDEYRLKTRLYARLDLPLWETPVEAAEVSAAVPDLEILTQPQMSNPSWVSADQLQRLLPLFPEWPEQGDPGEVVVVDEHGAELGDPATNAVVESIAMRVVTEDYEARGWKVEDVSLQNVGWDLTCRKSRDKHLVEVKGRSIRKPVVLLTPNELRAAREDPGWCLAVVTDALNRPVLAMYDAAEAVEAAQPLVYRIDLT